MKQHQGIFIGQDLSQAYDNLTKDTISMDDILQCEYESMLDNRDEFLTQHENLTPQKSITEIMQKKNKVEKKIVVKRYLSCKWKIQEDFEVEEIGNNRFQMKKKISKKQYILPCRPPIKNSDFIFQGEYMRHIQVFDMKKSKKSKSRQQQI
ncbi:hypothetical protein TTHERM_00492300 (macronuclear) [Tetrahymena thermophila SB210]|uniref:Uncharacterized protein n=1 Tax=Tetrahymena thermophila (strain SB210) TaxID=312017 RepID=I7LWU4_TETTS|nr:hypothetical protein TTHERM_00492300 [Tetrahymena thermophila SB210]EAS02877.2 hypothetical protein TTHERM_00492300 [Tetrahymena thermophila SB210]|eukprot:XP_001023122.2 hypothetical protein TTHERM_00492300 [Tetrahymena thermophila SB210]